MAKTSPESSDWASLPPHLLDSVVEKLTHLPDFVRFAAVSKPWFSAATTTNHQRNRRGSAHNQIPMLIVPSSSSEEKRSLYSIPHNKLYDFKLSLPYKLRCCGSSHGWLATVDENYAITLVNPFSSSSSSSGVSPITLPRLQVFETDVFDDSTDRLINYEYHVHKVVLSADPSLDSTNYEAAAIYGDRDSLALIKSGEKDWTYIGNDKLSLVSDVVYSESQFLALDRWNGLTSVRFQFGTAPELETVKPRTQNQSQPSYLVQSSAGDLLRVERFLDVKDDPYQWMTFGFKVCKLRKGSSSSGGGGGPPIWVEIDGDGIGGDALFVGDNHSFSLVASQFPGCQANSIYYTDDYTDIVFYEPFGPRDMGIYNLEDKSFRLHYTPNPLHKGMPPPIWIVPTLVGKLGLN